MTICSESRPCWLIIYIKKKSYGKTAVLVRRVAPQDRHRKVRRRLSCMVHQSSPGTRKTRINLSLTPFLSLSGIMSLAALRIRSGIRWKKKLRRSLARHIQVDFTRQLTRQRDLPTGLQLHPSSSPHRLLQATVERKASGAPAERSMRECTFSYTRTAQCKGLSRQWSHEQVCVCSCCCAWMHGLWSPVVTCERSCHESLPATHPDFFLFKHTYIKS